MLSCELSRIPLGSLRESISACTRVLGTYCCYIEYLDFSGTAPADDIRKKDIIGFVGSNLRGIKVAVIDKVTVKVVEGGIVDGGCDCLEQK